MARYVRLGEHGNLLDQALKQGSKGLYPYRLRQFLWVLIHGYCMEVYNAIVAIVLILKFRKPPYGAEVIAYM